MSASWKTSSVFIFFKWLLIMKFLKKLLNYSTICFLSIFFENAPRGGE